MLQKILNILKIKNTQSRLHKQFQDIQKWQDEMYFQKSCEELENIH